MELRCVDKAFSTDVLSGRLTGGCVRACQGPANQRLLMSHQGELYRGAVTGRHGDVNASEA